MSPVAVETFGTTVGARTSWLVQFFLQPLPLLLMWMRAKPGWVTAPELGPNGSW